MHLKDTIGLKFVNEQVFDLVVHGARTEALLCETESCGVVLIDGRRLKLRSAKVCE